MNSYGLWHEVVTESQIMCGLWPSVTSVWPKGVFGTVHQTVVKASVCWEFSIRFGFCWWTQHRWRFLEQAILQHFVNWHIISFSFSVTFSLEVNFNWKNTTYIIWFTDSFFSLRLFARGFLDILLFLVAIIHITNCQ